MNSLGTTENAGSRPIRILVTLGAAMLAALPSFAAPLPARVDFNYHIKPLLSDRCFFCHGPDEKGRKGKLRLDTPEGAFKALEGGMSVVKPGDPAKSELLHRLTSTDPEEVMPPPKANLALSTDEIALFKKWIEQGAEWKKHWAFIPVGNVPVPDTKNRKWARNEVDRFVLAKLEAEKLKPAPEATKERLLRRVSLDLTGLPPTPAEVDAFLTDKSPNAYEKVVDRLLASPTYGERMAVEWLDVARYADTYGYQADRINHLWPWRDWVIKSFNRNIRINQFIIEQLAGDLLPDATQDQKVATAFNRLHRQTNEGGSVNEEFRVEYNADRVHTLGGAFLGLTMECARCHDHKYDPVSQMDYYRLFAFFNSTDESGLYSHFTDAIPTPTTLLYKDGAEQKHRALKQAVTAKEKELEAYRALAQPAFEKWLTEVNASNASPPATPGRGESPGSRDASSPQLFPRFGTARGLIGHYSFDNLTNNTSRNLAATNFHAKLSEGPKSVTGRFGQALQFDGENSVRIDKFADFKRTDPFSFSLYINPSEELPEIVVLHHQQAGSDSGYQGYQLVLEDGHASFGLIHFWPGNAIKVRTKDKLPLNAWTHVGVTYDGSSRAAGLKLFVNGQPAVTEVEKDKLTKDFANGQPLALAARFRSRGFKDGMIDELKVFNRGLSAVEMHELGGAFPTENGSLQFADRAAALDYYLATADEGFAKQLAELKKLRDDENNFINRIPEIMGMGDLPTPRPTYVLKRGEYDKRAETVEPDTPANILPMDPKLPRNRLGLAQWFVDRQNPLTARVLVNRYWQNFFGHGLVLTAEDFGSQGALPTHPELLDWLAMHFMETGWDLKALCKLIVTSATYRQSSEVGPELLARDPDNKLLARGPKTRLTAEMLRDQALAASGLLVQKLGGPSVKPYQPEGIWEDTAGSSYTPDKGEGLYRRSLYTFWKRTAPHPMMTTFDASERNTCVVRRQPTSTPLQALVLLNDPQMLEAARRIGEQVLKSNPGEPRDQVTETFLLLTGRKPTAKELRVLQKLRDDQLALFRVNRDGAEAMLKIGESAIDPKLDRAELAAATAVASAVMNFDEAILKR
ncbi:MAG: DUF1553 domain-containing protein [Verrucomicrobia bacterium]|nr:DUF1553 domain-containing protein [Verrucomicrobiota bacterium]